MKPPLLTLITITKDDSAGLARTLASAQALRGGGAEHLVVDGAEGGSSEKPENAGELGIQVLLRSPRG
ncbi:MAG: hypothetical protein ABIZ81_06105, partial [Opitutaceae bacterium]